MGKLHFPPDAQLTGPDRLILGFLEKDYEAYDQAKEGIPSDVADESDDSATKRTEFVSPSPEGRVEDLTLDGDSLLTSPQTPRTASSNLLLT
jgi:hypothetical protein